MTKQHLQDVFCGSNYADQSFAEKQEELLTKLIAARYNLPEEAVCLEMLDFFKIVAKGAKKYALNEWLKSDSRSMQHSQNHNSMFHHLAESYCENLVDTELREHPLLLLQCRAGMGYVRHVRQINVDEELDD